jgi:ATP-dependent DNA helicase RecG
MKVHSLPISVSDLLDRHIVESERLELKAGWNPAAIMRSVCAFANDFQNLGGGYVLIGTEAKDGLPVLPPKGVPHGQIDKIQKELLQYCRLIQPNYFPILSIEKVSGRTVLVIWCPGGQNRPYKVPVDVCVKAKDYQYYIRRYSNSVIANDALNKKRIVARRYRNRRIGEFLKELGLTEGRATGIPKIYDALERNGSPRPHIETDEGRTYFLIKLPIHPAFKAPVKVPVKATVKGTVKGTVKVPVAEGVSLNKTERKILLFSKVRPVGRKELLTELGYSTFVGSVRMALRRLKELHLLELTIPDKPSSRNQRYRITNKGRQVLGVVKWRRRYPPHPGRCWRRVNCALTGPRV